MLITLTLTAMAMAATLQTFEGFVVAVDTRAGTMEIQTAASPLKLSTKGVSVDDVRINGCRASWQRIAAESKARGEYEAHSRILKRIEVVSRRDPDEIKSQEVQCVRGLLETKVDAGIILRGPNSERYQLHVPRGLPVSGRNGAVLSLDILVLGQTLEVKYAPGSVVMVISIPEGR